MGVLSGIGGAVDGEACVRTWTIATTADVQNAVCSASKQGTIVIDGNEDWSGSFTQYGHTPNRMPQDSFTFTGSIDGSNGAVGTAIVDSVEITIDIEAGAIIGIVTNFSGNGAVTLGAAVASDSTTPDPATSIGCKVEVGTMVGSPVWTEITDVRTVTITITADNQSYVSSSTAGKTKRTAGNISAAIAVTVYEDDFADLPAVNSDARMRVYVNATEFWLFEFVRFGEASDLTVDRETAALVGATLNASWTGFAEVDGSMTEGQIVEPDTTKWWAV